MSNNQLRWHLLKEVTDILVQKLEDDVDRLFPLLMSGKGPAQAVRMIISPEVKLIEEADNDFDIEIKFNGDDSALKPVYFKKLALRWARNLNLYNYECNISVVPDYVAILQDHSSVEKLCFTEYEEFLPKAIAIIHACPNLSVLAGGQAFLSLLLQRTDVNLTKIRAIQIEDLNLRDDGEAEFKVILETLANHPERFTLFDALTILVDSKLSDVLQCMSRHVIPAVKSLEIKKSSWNRPSIDFSQVGSITKVFPNIENVCLSYVGEYVNEEDMKPVQAFKEFEPSFHFEFNYNLKIMKSFSTEAELQSFDKNLKSVMSAYGTDDTVVKQFGTIIYAATNSYPNKAMKFEHKTMGYGLKHRRHYWTDEDKVKSVDNFIINLMLYCHRADKLL